MNDRSIVDAATSNATSNRLASFQRGKAEWGELIKQLDFQTGWARLGWFSQLLAAQIRPLSPPILILALPRSGTSWVGSTLGQAANAMYLREPVNESYHKHGGVDSVIRVDPLHPPSGYESAAERAFAAIPNFDRSVVEQPAQWSLHQRSHRRLVIKEVNPLACAWYLHRFRPRMIFLVRHPAGVALSHKKLNWGATDDEQYWQRHGTYQGEVLRATLDVLQSFQDHTTVLYEDLCANPFTAFRSLYRFAGLEWDQRAEAWIAKHTSAGERTDPYGTQRKSSEVAQAWQREITPGALAELQQAYQAFALPWYQSTDDWQIA